MLESPPVPANNCVSPEGDDMEQAMRAWLLIIILLAPAGARAQEPNETDITAHFTGEQLAELQQKAFRLIQATRDLGDWEQQYVYVLDAVERVFERNDWESESDLFALEIFRDVSQIPPWDPMARFERAIEMVGDRYLLDEDQMASLQNHIIQTNVGLFTKHADRIMEYAIDAIETRAAGEPFTPEQIARWTELAEPVFLDARKSANELVRDFGKELDPEQRELLQRDMDAANRRMNDMERMATRWKRGEWDPHDWGMEDDPIQNPGGRNEAEAAEVPGAAATRRPGARRAAPAAREESTETATEAAAAEPPPSDPRRADPTTTRQASEDDPWAQYVRDFIKRYDLDSEQQQRAWIYHRDAKERDAVFARRFERRAEPLREKAADDERARVTLERRTEEHRAEHERLFEQLKERLERLPTRAQRRSAEGPTQMATGTGELRISLIITRMELTSPPGVSRRSSTRSMSPVRAACSTSSRRSA